MTVRITVLEDRPVRRIRVEGRLSAEEIGELEQLIGNDRDATCLELGDLRSADAAALSVLRRLREEGISMNEVPLHLAWRIESEGP